MTLLAWGRLHAPPCVRVCSLPTLPASATSPPSPTQAWLRGGPVPSRVWTGLSTCLSRPSSPRQPHRHPLPGRWGSFHLHRLVGLRRAAWTAQPRCPGWPSPAGPTLCFARASSAYSPPQHPVLSWVAVRGLPRSQEAQMKEGLTGATAGPLSPEMASWAPGASASPGVERHHTSAGRSGRGTRSSPGPPGPAAASLLARQAAAPPGTASPPTRLLCPA